MNDDNILEQFLEFRREAERKAAQSPDILNDMSPEDMVHLVHELQVSQIELEMQNENLRAIYEQLDEARARYFDLYDLAPVGYLTLSEKGLILEANLTVATMLGISRSALTKKPVTQFIFRDDQDVYYFHRKLLFDTGQPQQCELRMVKSDGSVFWGGLNAVAAHDAENGSVCRVILHDITENKLHEEERDMTERMISLVNEPGDFHQCIASLTDALKAWAGCDAVGIRLRSGDDFPYYETRGFPPTFIRDETQLCAFGPDGKVLLDAIGKPVLECLCGMVLSGRFDPSKPWFTAQGSFWTNSTTAMLADIADFDPQARRRNRCNSAGYESLALVPLRSAGQVFGLLQFNDFKPNRFTSQLMTHFEHMANSLAIALSRRQAQEALETSEELYQKLAQHLETVREEERTHIARELHDDLGQVLTAIRIDLVTMFDQFTDPDMTAKKENVFNLLREGIESVHSLCRQLRPGALDDLGLEEALAGLLDDWNRRNSLECTFSVDIDEEVLSNEIRTAVFRIVQEALTNVSRHARASTVGINLVADSQKLCFSICDNGCGVAEGAEGTTESFGLLGMRERISALGGEFRIESSPGQGTLIEGIIPLTSSGSVE